MKYVNLNLGFIKLLSFVIIFSSNYHLLSQTIYGKLVDKNSIGLSGLQLKLYSNGNLYSTFSGKDGSFTFRNVTSILLDKQLPTGYSVSNNYPNPFNPRTRFYIILPNQGNVKVSVYNIIGQEVRDEIDKDFGAGINFIELELNGLPNGVYFAKINIDEKYSVTKKMMLLYGSQHLASSSTYSANILSSSFDNHPNIEITKKNQSIKIDSIIVTGSQLKKNSFTHFSSIADSSAKLGDLVINTTTSGIPCKGIPTIVFAGKTYNTVQIGTQCWLKENLDVGSILPTTQDQTNNEKVEKYCYNDEPSNCEKYGGLYQWSEAIQYKNGATDTTTTNPTIGGNVQGICPNGWHIPSQSEFQTLSTLMNENSNALKEIGEGTGNSSGTNNSGFSALLNGYRDFDGRFRSFTYFVYIWSSNEYDSLTAPYMGLDYGYTNIYFFNYVKKCGFSVRCVLD